MVPTWSVNGRGLLWRLYVQEQVAAKVQLFTGSNVQMGSRIPSVGWHNTAIW